LGGEGEVVRLSAEPGAEAERDPVRRRKLHEEVAVRLEDMMLSGRYAVGDQLPSERELMERFGVGRPAIREALMSLEKMGLVAISSGERARVTRPTPEVMVHQLSGAARHLLAEQDGVRHFQQARRMFETGLARHAAEHASPADVAELEAALERNHAALDRDLREFNRTDVAFHYALATITRNPIFTALHQAMVSWLTEQRTMSLKNPGASRGAYGFHRRIYEAVAAHDPDGAERAMREHLDEVERLYWQAAARDSSRPGTRT
jgi:GntR family transcriptional regulator, sialic acid-inducible nan operon repressor